jgi:hypothetical protein
LHFPRSAAYSIRPWAIAIILGGAAVSALNVPEGSSPSPIPCSAGWKTGEPLAKVIHTTCCSAWVIDAAGLPATRAHPPHDQVGEEGELFVPLPPTCSISSEFVHTGLASSLFHSEAGP